VVKHGKTDTGKQRNRCPNPDRSHQSFRLAPAYRGHLPEIKQQVIEMSLQPFFTTVHPSAVDIIIRRVGDPEADEMWSFVGEAGATVALACHRSLDRHGLSVCLWPASS
jgi:hypothetical protein